MTRQTAERPRPAASAPSGPPILAIALGALLVVVAVGFAVALAGGSDGGSGQDQRAAFGAVEVDGVALPAFVAGAGDPAVGALAPALAGAAADGAATVIEPGRSTLVVFLAHWCPHCQAELPRLVEAAAAGTFDGIRTVAVVTGTNPDAPNFPPDEWLEREGWSGDVLLDDEAASAASAYGLDGYPFLVALDPDGAVIARTSGQLTTDQLAGLAEAIHGQG